jgi:palmitoyltransferase
MSVRRHGLERPLDTHQVASWGVLLFFFAFFYSFYVPVHRDSVGIALTVLYSVSAVLATFFGLKTTGTDPADPNARAKREARRPTDPVPTPRAADNYCYLCEASVARRSKHCRRCNKCVGVFDHHCPWVNNCIGSGNYRYFLAMLTATFAMTSLQFGCGVQVTATFGGG